MKILTILGTRPEIIRLSQVIPLLDATCDHKIVHTGQNYDYHLDRVFFEGLGIRSPNVNIGCGAKKSFAGQYAMIIDSLDQILEEEKPDKFLVLGDTNSSLGAVVAQRRGIPVYHMEAGNRCYDKRSPEEVNRRIIDHSSDVLLPYTARSKENLVAEGISAENIYVTGNPIAEVLDYYTPEIQESRILETMRLKPHQYFLVTLHREENVDSIFRLAAFLEAFRALHSEFKFPIVISAHPRTRKSLKACSGDVMGKPSYGHIWADPFGFFDFVKLEQEAACVFTDSGTVQEECCIQRVRSVILRDFHERPETVECGSTIIGGSNKESILQAAQAAMEMSTCWEIPTEYTTPFVSQTVAKILLGS